MAYYIEIRPRGSKPVTIEEFKRRFFDLGFEPHPALACKTEAQWVKDHYKDDVATSVGVITVQEWASSPCGVTSFLRLSWRYDSDDVSIIVALLLLLVSRIGADVLGREDEVITVTNMESITTHFAKGKRVTVGALGTCQPH